MHCYSGITAAINVLTIICFVADRCAYLSKSNILRVYTFPFFWTGVWNLFAWYSPLGDLFTYSQSAMLWNSFRQIASFGGRAMLDFFMAWFGTVVVETLVAASDQPENDNSGHIINKLPDADVPEMELDYSNEKLSLWRKIKTLFTPLSIFCLIFSVLLGYGGGQVSIIPGSFFQTSYPDYITPNVIRAGCVIGNTDDTGYSPLDRQYWFDQTVQLAKVRNSNSVVANQDFLTAPLAGWCQACCMV
jgi:hypothetical protein